LGPRGASDERATADPYVIEAGGRLFLYYLGEDRARRQRLGAAVSDDGLTWNKLRGNPVLELGIDGAFDENGLGEPAVWLSHGWWWMLYTGRDRKEVRRLGLARSRDGIHWERTGSATAGAETWNSRVLCDATVAPDREKIRVWFGGGDTAHPAENIRGQIGYGELRWDPRR
jgi:sucrose-6-phosphate hydrolase SacC (GH32 family)